VDGTTDNLRLDLSVTLGRNEAPVQVELIWYDDRQITFFSTLAVGKDIHGTVAVDADRPPAPGDARIVAYDLQALHDGEPVNVKGRVRVSARRLRWYGRLREAGHPDRSPCRGAGRGFAPRGRIRVSGSRGPPHGNARSSRIPLDVQPALRWAKEQSLARGPLRPSGMARRSTARPRARCLREPVARPGPLIGTRRQAEVRQLQISMGLGSLVQAPEVVLLWHGDDEFFRYGPTRTRASCAAR
jgi:hypothetical protein